MVVPPSPSNVPIPDPSIITAQEIARLRVELRDEFRTALKSEHDLLITGGVGRHEKALLKIDALEKALLTFEANLNRVPTQLDREAARLESLFGQKLVVVEERFRGIDKLTVAMEKSSEKAVDSAFMASDRAVNAQYSNFTKEIDGLKALLSSKWDQLTSDLSNLTGRLDRGEGGWQGGRLAVEDRHRDINTTTLVTGGIVGFLVLMVSVVSLVFSIEKTSPPAINPTVGADTKRVDDLIAATQQQSRETGARIDALSARINALTPTLAPSPPAK